jgi:hypothetical protein
MTSIARFAAVALALVGGAAPAHALFHFWQVNEVFSNSDGSVQFVEFFTTQPLQSFLAGHAIETRSQGATLETFTFPSVLPVAQSTANRFFVAATADFAAAAGIEPDYEIPAAFLDPALVDAVVLVGGAPGTTFSFAAGSIPTDGLSSLDRAAGVGPATPTNFAGEVGTLPEPEARTGALAAAAALALLARPLGGRLESRPRHRRKRAQRARSEAQPSEVSS